MGEKLIRCSGPEAVRKFQKSGWTVVRQKSSHVMMTKPGYHWTLSIPQHKEPGPGLLRKLIRQADLKTKTFNDLKHSGLKDNLIFKIIESSNDCHQRTTRT